MSDTLDWLRSFHCDPLETEAADDGFDPAAIDAALGWQEPGEVVASERTDTAEALVKVLTLLLPPRLCRQGVQAAGLRCLALAWMLDAGNIRQLSQGELAARGGFSKAALSAAIKGLEAATGLRCRGMTTKSGCEAHKAGAVKGWATRRKRKP
jgi:hypothetical protein